MNHQIDDDSILDNLSVKRGTLLWKGKPLRTQTDFTRGIKTWGVFIAVATLLGTLIGAMANLDRAANNFQKYILTNFDSDEP